MIKAFWDNEQCSLVVVNLIIALMMEAVRTSETSVDNYFTRQYIPEDKSENQRNLLENSIRISLSVQEPPAQFWTTLFSPLLETPF
jgi:hypothetical protein